MLLGKLEHKEHGVEVQGEYSKMFDRRRYMFALDAPFLISSRCCSIMKKAPIKEFNKVSGKKSMTAQMASESRLRTEQWLRYGCNAFDSKNPISNPMAFWTEQDVLLYIKQNNIEICSVYGEIVIDDQTQLKGQMSLTDYASECGLFDIGNPLLKTTGCSRTGCVFCGFGAHCKDDDRFKRLKETHPQIHDYIMRPADKGGLNYKEVIDWINENNGKGKIIDY